MKCMIAHFLHDRFPVFLYSSQTLRLLCIRGPLAAGLKGASLQILLPECCWSKHLEVTFQASRLEVKKKKKAPV